MFVIGKTSRARSCVEAQNAGEEIDMTYTVHGPAGSGPVPFEGD